jgi:apolipoprotein N-acyltransferase
MSVQEIFFRLVPVLGVVLGVAHGAGANHSKFAWLQALALTLALLVCFFSARARRTGIFVSAALSFALASSVSAHLWLGETLTRDDSLGLALGCCVFAALMIGIAILPAMSIVIASQFFASDSARRFAPLVLALLYPLAEMTAAELVGFGWHAAGYAWVETSLAILLPTIGVYGVGALIVLLCSWLAAMLVGAWIEGPHATRGRWIGAGVLSFVVIAALVLGGPHPSSDVTTTIRTRLVQTNVPVHQKFDLAALGTRVAEIAKLASGADADLIVAPETAIPVAWLQLPLTLREPLVRVAADGKRLFLVGMFDFRDDGAQLNVASGLRGDPGLNPPPRYSKQRLVPVAEYSPFGLGWIANLLALPYDDRVSDDAPEPSFVVAGARIKNTICLDLAYPGDFAATAPVTGIIVNQSNFSAFAGERVREQFLTIARTRALEQRKPVLIASNAGPTAAIAADGRILARLPATDTAIIDVAIQPGAAATLYATLGEVTWIALLALAILGTAMSGRSPRA